MNGRKLETGSKNFKQFLAVIGHAAAGATEGKAGTNDHRKSDFSRELETVFQIVDQRRFRHIKADALHGILEVKPVFSLLDCIDVRADQLDVVLVEHAVVGKFNREIKGGLPAYRGKNGEARAGRHLALDTNNFFQVFAAQRLDVSAIRRLGIGHDRCRVRVRKHNLEAFRLQRLAGLRAGVVKLGGLPDDDRARADNEDFGDVSAFGHEQANLWR